MIRTFIAIFLCLVLGVGASVTALAEKRVALVIGNSAYEHVAALPNPRNDAEQIASMLKSLGFSVHHKQDLGKADMDRTLAAFTDAAAGADVAAVFFAGHGLEVNGVNYLIPVDSQLKTDRTLTFEAVSLNQVLVALDDVKGIRIVLLDACRDNPFTQSMKRGASTRSIGRGLARIETSSGTLVSFAAKAGQIAADGDGPNSPFTTALLKNLSEPGLDIGLLFRKVRDSVYQATGGAQEPFVSASLTGKQTYLVPPKTIQPGQPGTNPVQQSAAAASLTTNRQIELAIWNAIKSANDSTLLKDYLNRYPLGEFALIAKQRLKKLASLAPSTAKVEKPPSERDKRALIRDVQTALSDAGCRPGAIDGFWGRRGKRALRAFNRATDQNLSINSPSEATLAAIKKHEGAACHTAGTAQKPSVGGSQKARGETRKKRKKKARENRAKQRKTAKRTKASRKAKQRSKRAKRKVAKRRASGGAKRAGCIRVVRRVCAGVFGSGAGLGNCVARGRSRCRRTYP